MKNLRTICRIEKRTREYFLKGHKVLIQKIENLGELVIIQGEEPSKIAKLLELRKPIDKTFCEMVKDIKLGKKVIK